MPFSTQRRLQRFTIIAKDPSVTIGGKKNRKILTTQVAIPAEELSSGPRGYRVQVIDYDASTGLLYPSPEYQVLENGSYLDPFENEPDEALLGDPTFHAQNVYVIVMRILARFEQALGRRVSWSFGGHQLQVAPHAFLDTNAFYSKDDRSLLFGYFPRQKKAEERKEEKAETAEGDGAKKKLRYKEMVFTCLSHDVVAHETTHALLDGLRERYTDPSSPEQAGFHEGFADVVALLSIFSLQDVVGHIIDQVRGRNGRSDPSRISSEHLQEQRLRKSLLAVLGKEIGEEIGRGTALRRSVEELVPGEDYLGGRRKEEFKEPHRRGELLVAAMMNAFLKIWVRRCESLRSGDRSTAAGERIGPEDQRPRPVPQQQKTELLDRNRVVEEGATIADHMLTMAIRALDYCPPTDLQFCDFLSALLTADREVRPDDSRFRFREMLLHSFEEYGFRPTSKGDGSEPGVWEPPPPEVEPRYDRVHLESMLWDENEMFRFIWENRRALGLDLNAYTRVLSVRPAVRVNPDDGFVLRETVAEYYQILNVLASELKNLGIKKPADMPDEQNVTLYGGGTLIFDEFARLKYHVRNRLLNPERQTSRLGHLWRFGHFDHPQVLEREALRDHRFARMHQRRFAAATAIDREADHDEYF